MNQITTIHYLKVHPLWLHCLHWSRVEGNERISADRDFVFERMVRQIKEIEMEI